MKFFDNKKLVIFILALGIILFFSLYKKVMKKPSIILLITIESLRPDHLGFNGYKNISPNIDQLARRGVVFNAVRVPVPQTVFSIPSLFTSTYPIFEGKFTFDYSNETFAPSLLKKYGYETYAFVDNQIPAYIGNYFDHFRYVSNCSFQNKMVFEIIEKNAKVFIWMHYGETHLPYGSYVPPLFKGIYRLRNTTKERETAIKYYDEEIKNVDKCVGELLSFLKERNKIENSLIIVTADHGEELYEHGNLIGHGYSLVEEEIKVPLIIFYPRFFKEKKKVNCSVSSLDIFPTIFELIGKGRKFGEGKSLLPLISKCQDRYTYHFAIPLRVLTQEVTSAGINHSFGFFVVTFQINCGNMDNFEKCVVQLYATDKISRVKENLLLIDHFYPGVTIVCVTNKKAISIIGNESIALNILNSTNCENIWDISRLNVSLQPLRFPYPLEVAVVNGMFKLRCFLLPPNRSKFILFNYSSSVSHCNLYKVGGKVEKKITNSTVQELLKEKLREFLLKKSLKEFRTKTTVTSEIIYQLRKLGYLP